MGGNRNPKHDCSKSSARIRQRRTEGFHCHGCRGSSNDPIRTPQSALLGGFDVVEEDAVDGVGRCLVSRGKRWG